MLKFKNIDLSMVAENQPRYNQASIERSVYQTQATPEYRSSKPPRGSVSNRSNSSVGRLEPIVKP